MIDPQIIAKMFAESYCKATDMQLVSYDVSSVSEEGIVEVWAKCISNKPVKYFSGTISINDLEND